MTGFFLLAYSDWLVKGGMAIDTDTTVLRYPTKMYHTFRSIRFYYHMKANVSLDGGGAGREKSSRRCFGY